MLSFATLDAQNVQRGKASFYSKRATGARASSGEKIHHDSLTCAHRTYPFGTMLKVTNITTGKSVNVRVIDRGPFARGRIIDLSWAAAKEIGMLAQGIATVVVERADNLIVPFKPEPEDHLFELDFERLASDDTDGVQPSWQEMKDAVASGNKAHGRKHGNNAKNAQGKHTNHEQQTAHNKQTTDANKQHITHNKQTTEANKQSQTANKQASNRPATSHK